MGAFKQYGIYLFEQALLGDDSARQQLVDLGSPDGLRGISRTLDAVADYVDMGLSVVPQQPAEKQPCVRWKCYQDERPSVADLYDWYTYWPDAGVALILGPVSDVMAIDVDGTEAHRTLVSRLGGVPKAPHSISGSGKPHRYHLFFQHPDLETKARATPWHPQLEFRGNRGIVILPPSKHKSGKRYKWWRGRSLLYMRPPQLPQLVIEALKERKTRPAVPAERVTSTIVVEIKGISRLTKLFLSGKFAHQPGWNNRLFAAACDLAGNGVRQDKAIDLLLDGAKPITPEDELQALVTIDSAYCHPRVPARRFAESISWKESR